MHPDEQDPDCSDSDRSGLPEGSEAMKWSREELEHFVDGLIDEACSDGVVIEGRIATKARACARSAADDKLARVAAKLEASIATIGAAQIPLTNPEHVALANQLRELNLATLKVVLKALKEP